MARMLADRLSEASRGAFIGRESEVRSVSEGRAGPRAAIRVAFIHRPGRNRKTSLLRADRRLAAEGLPEAAARLSRIEPTAHGVLSAISALIGMDAKRTDIEALSRRLSGGASRGVLAFDNYDAFGLADSWLRQALLPPCPLRS